jgi:hypothetical protein
VAVGLVTALVACETAAPEDPLARSVALIPPVDDGAALVELVGAAVTSVTTPEGEVFFHARGDTTRVVVVRGEPGPLAFDFRVADPSASLVATVLQVADGENRLRDPAAYGAELGR